MKWLSVPGGVASAGEFSGYLVAIVLGFNKKKSCRTILDFPPENSMVYISPNWSGGGMLTIFEGTSDPFTSKYMTICAIDVW